MRTLKLCTFFIIQLLVFDLFGQLPPGINNTNVYCESELVAANFEIAKEYAPVFEQQVGTDGNDKGHKDFIVKMDFDGDWIMHNNQENMLALRATNTTSAQIMANPAFSPRIYYMVSWLECEWVITYTVFHPIDWNQCNWIPFYNWFDSHENDSESAVVYVSRTDFSINRVSGIFHHDVKTTTSPTLSNGTHPLIKVDNETHAVVPWPMSTDDPGCHSAYDYLCYYSFSTGTPSLTLTEDSDNNVTAATGTYDLVSIFAPGELWSQKDNPNTATPFKFVGDNGSVPNQATLPWKYGQLPLCEPESSGSGQCDFVFSQCSPQGKDLIVTEDLVIDGETINEFTRIIVKDEANLTLKNCHITMNYANWIENGSITVRRGSSLELDNTTITTCSNNKWRGIVLELQTYGSPVPLPAPNLTIKNQSVIENSIFGVHHNYFNTQSFNYDDYPEVAGNSSNILITGSTFRNNFEAINIRWSIQNFYGIPVANYSIIHDNTFINNDIALKTNDSKNIEVYDNEFNNNRIGINAVEAFIEVSNGNEFISNEYGILLEGTFPLASGGIIGDQGNGFNEFKNNEALGILANGVDNPIGLHVTNNLFSNNDLAGAGAIGANKATISFNTFEGGVLGLGFSGTGSNFNKVSCNEFEGVTDSDSRFLGENDNTQILGNAYNSVIDPMSSFGNIDLVDATIPNQGTSQNPAGNCFQDNSTIEISKTADTDQFQYRYFDDSNEDLDMDGVIDDCQTPYSLPPSWIEVTLNKAAHCENDQVGIFSNIVGDPNGDPGIYVKDDDPSNPCISCIKNEIDISVIRLVNVGGDDPTTYIDEEVYTNDVIAYESQILDEWINYGLYVALANQDYQFAIDILTPFQAWEWQIRLYGIYMLQYDYVNAQAVLNNLPSNTANEADFKTVQQINLDRRTYTGTEPYVLSSQDEQALETIGLSDSPSSGYARSLYHKLKKIVLPIDFDGGSRSNPRFAADQSVSTANLKVYPNPSFGFIQLSNIENLNSYEVYNLQGQLMTSGLIESSTIDLTNLDNGLYFLIATDNENLESSFKIFIEK